jgi:hypothetical protein
MKAAVLKIGALGMLSLLGLASAIGATRGTGGPVETVTSVVSSVAGQTGAVATATGGAPDPASTGALTDPTSTAGGVPGGTAGGAGAALPVPRLRTTFDRLPRRLEALLERIVVGQAPGANLRRLERALRAAPPELRARVLRLLQAEMRRLKQGGLTRSERERYRRLRRVLKALSQPGPSSAIRSQSAPLPAQSGDPESGAPSERSGLNPTSPGDSHPVTGAGSQRSSGSTAGKDRDVGGFGSQVDLPPAWEWNIQLGIYLALLGLLLFALAALLLAAVPADALPTRQLRRLVRTSRAALALMGATTLVALALIVFL